MWPAALGALIAIGLGLRTTYPARLERRVRQRLPLDADGIVVGGAPIAMAREAGAAALLLHGAGDTPQVMAGLAKYLHEEGFSVRAPLLSGHGRTVADFGRVSAEQWQDDARQAFEALRHEHDWVAIVGLSMGAALAVSLAAQRGDVDALVLLSPYVAMPRLLRSAAASSALWAPLYPYFSSRGSRSIHDPAAAARGLGHGIFTPAALKALHRVVVTAERSLARVSAPTLMIQSREDNRIPTSAAERIFDALGARDKKLEWVSGAGHVISVDYGHQRVYALTAAWLKEHHRLRRVTGKG